MLTSRTLLFHENQTKDNSPEPGLGFYLGTLALLMLVTTLLYGKTLSYRFVYDDDWRIVKNPAVQTLTSPLQYIFDPSTQAGHPLIWGHTYRPLPTYFHALSYSLWGEKPGFFRLQNLIFHSLNGFLVACLGIILLGLSPPAAILAALIFIVHPIQTEAVVWISELSGVLSVTWILMGITTWIGYRREKNSRYLFLSYFFLFLGFLTRENGVCLAPAIILIDILLLKKRDKTQHVLLSGLTVSYLVWRTVILGKVSQAPLWGGNVFTNLANVIQTLPLYFQSIFWPHALRIIHSDIPIVKSLNAAVAKGLLIVIAYIFLLAWAYRKSIGLFLGLLFIALFWLPGSNLVPLNTLFAERLIYPMMIALVWAVGWFIDAQPWKEAKKGVIPFALVLVMGWRTSAELPKWKDEDSLWRNAVRFEPNNFFAWACLANAQMKQINDLKNPSSEQRGFLLGEAEKFYRHALDCHPAAYTAGEILICLAEVNLQQGKREVALKNAKEGVRLRPDLKDRVHFVPLR